MEAVWGAALEAVWGAALEAVWGAAVVVMVTVASSDHRPCRRGPQAALNGSTQLQASSGRRCPCPNGHIFFGKTSMEHRGRPPHTCC